MNARKPSGPLRRLLHFALASKLSVLTRLACLSAGLSLVFMVVIVTVKIPLILVLGVGVAHGLGILGVLLFATAVIKESMLYRPRSLMAKMPSSSASESSGPAESYREAPAVPPRDEPPAT